MVVVYRLFNPLHTPSVFHFHSPSQAYQQTADDAEDEDAKTDDNDEEKDEVSEMPSIPLATKTTTGAFDIGHNDDDDDDFSLYSSSVPISVPRHSRNISFDKFDKVASLNKELKGAIQML